MHSRRKGKSGSKKPIRKVLPTWNRYKQKEVELLAVKLAKEGKTVSEIGLHLRDTYGIPSTKLLTGKRITAMLREKKIVKEFPEDLSALIRKDVLILKHLEKNRKDEVAKRGKTLTQSKINRLVKYYKRTGIISSGWKYDPKRASILAE